MRKAYLTIDDSPSACTDDLTDALASRGIPALLFCRGDLLEADPAPVIRAIEKGFVIGNHGYWHKRASILGFEKTCEGIDRTEDLIAGCYDKAGRARTGKYYRFAYMDRGMGPWFVEPERVRAEDRPYMEHMIREGLANDPSALPTHEMIEIKNRLQAFLKVRGYVPPKFDDVTHGFYRNSEMARAVDTMFTFSTSDWAMNARHKGKYGFDTVNDLKTAMDKDVPLSDESSAHIILVHDQSEIHDVTLDLIDHLQAINFSFGAFA